MPHYSEELEMLWSVNRDYTKVQILRCNVIEREQLCEFVAEQGIASLYENLQGFCKKFAKIAFSLKFYLFIQIGLICPTHKLFMHYICSFE